MTPIGRDGLDQELIRRPAREGVADGKASGFSCNRLMDHRLLLGVGVSVVSVWRIDRVVISVIHTWPAHWIGGIDPER